MVIAPEFPDVADLRIVDSGAVPVNERAETRRFVMAVVERLLKIGEGKALEVPIPGRKQGENIQSRLRTLGFESYVRGAAEDGYILYAYGRS